MLKKLIIKLYEAVNKQAATDEIHSLIRELIGTTTVKL